MGGSCHSYMGVTSLSMSPMAREEAVGLAGDARGLAEPAAPVVEVNETFQPQDGRQHIAVEIPTVTARGIRVGRAKRGQTQ